MKGSWVRFPFSAYIIFKGKHYLFGSAFSLYSPKTTYLIQMKYGIICLSIYEKVRDSFSVKKYNLGGILWKRVKHVFGLKTW